MGALRVQHAGHGGNAGLLTQADSPVWDASSTQESGLRGAPGSAQATGVAVAEVPPIAEARGAGLPDAAGLAHAIAVVKAAAAAAPEVLALANYTGAAEYAGQVEDLSRTVEYLQILGAGAVDRTRTRAITDAAACVRTGGRTWITGWDNSTETLTETDPSWPHGTADPATAGDAGFTAPAIQSGARASSVYSAAPVPASPADDGCRNTAEFLRARLRISVSEAHRRISLAAAVLPRPGITGFTQQPERPELATALAAGTVASRAATIITLALDRVRHHATEDTTTRMEHVLTRTATENDTDFLTRIARRWTEAIDQDGAEPTEHELRQRQGAFLRPARRGLNHIEIFATPDQYEHLLTVMNTATNPRITPTTEACEAGRASEAGDPDIDLDRRTRPQQLLDGLVGACKAALTTDALPAAGGLRPQVMVTIDYRDLLDRLEHATEQGPRYRSRTAGTATDPGSDTDSRQGAGGGYGLAPDPGSTPGTGLDLGSGRIPGTGSFAFTGPVTASTVRKIACDADIIPVLLGSEGRILDIGRTTRIFPAHIRKAITARDQGCAFPGCTIPAPWCEAHHITYWSHGGTTSTDNGTLLCTHHHHLVHKEQWQIQVKTGIPWFIPPPHIDPRQKPQRNHHQT
ncbi:HNH endonuclease signature motif containing protein [Arthrobacter sp. S39]|uniref:HNH endonuclease signature motif containing protein n=1 Tax=Arthrobacter sp. S39 TaxID=2509720 RepID=UPI001F5EB96D|nr:HNH endonuclease signature motif containing protein [Arthrobacter sp. S39]